MGMITDKMISETALREGFALEFHVASIFSSLGGRVRTNVLFPRQQASMFEVDVISEHQGDGYKSIYIAECKGTSSSNILMLIASTNSEQTSYMPFLIERSHVGFDDRAVPISKLGYRPYVTYTGDFLANEKKDLLRRLDRNHKSNLYKAVGQLIEGIDLYYNRLLSSKIADVSEVIPLVVVNCEIAVVRYQGSSSDGSSLSPQIERKVKWALHRNTNYFCDTNLVDPNNWGMFTEFTNWQKKKVERYIPYVWIVHLDNLQQFIEFSKTWT